MWEYIWKALEFASYWILMMSFQFSFNHISNCYRTRTENGRKISLANNSRRRGKSLHNSTEETMTTISRECEDNISSSILLIVDSFLCRTTQWLELYLYECCWFFSYFRLKIQRFFLVEQKCFCLDSNDDVHCIEVFQYYYCGKYICIYILFLIFLHLNPLSTSLRLRSHIALIIWK